jgi:cytoskeletal protein CcmA (bactofilin family)
MIRKSKELNPNSTDTLVGLGSTVEGNITSKASLRIEGQLLGDIFCEGDVTIGEKAKLLSNISARNVYNAGQIEGSIQTRGVLTITPTGKVAGDINVKSLSIAEGGIFQGSSKMVTIPETPVNDRDKPSEPDRLDRKTHLQKVEKEAVNK